MSKYGYGTSRVWHENDALFCQNTAKLMARVHKNGTKLKTRMVLANTRMYIIIVGGEDDFATTKEAQKFLDSFEITR